MERRTFLETFGKLTKLEMVVSISQQTQPSYLILENCQPYPGYYNEVDTDTPRAIFLVTKEKLSIEEVIRLKCDAQKVINHQFDASSCSISIFGDAYNAIRVRHLKNFEMLHDLVVFLKGEGVSLVKYKNISEVATITVHKLFNFEEIMDGVYQDLDEPGERYLTISEMLDFGQFVRVTQAVKNNVEIKNFDAALAVFFRKKEIVDAVRVYEPRISIQNLLLLQRSYEEQIKRLKLEEI